MTDQTWREPCDRSRVLLNRVILMMFGLSHGTLIYLLVENKMSVPGLSRFSSETFLTITLLIGLLVVSDRRPVKDLVFTVLVAVIITFAQQLWLNTITGPDIGHNIEILYYVATTLTAIFFITIPTVFYQTYRITGKLNFPYPLLFQNSWSNKVHILVSLLFSVICWALLGLWAAMFTLLQINFFSDLFSDRLFIFLFSGTIFGLGVCLARERTTAIESLLKIVLVIFRILAPALGLIMLMFVATIAATGFDTLLQNHFTTRTILAAVILFFIFENAMIQGNPSEHAFWRPVEWLIMVTNVILPVLVAVTAWAMYQRVAQYGWTPPRYFVAILIAILAAYSAGYSAAVVFFRANWKKWVQRINPPMSIAVLLISLSFHLPPIEPYSFSAGNQVARLKDGRSPIYKFDFAYLQFKLGYPGKQALSAIERDEILAANPFIVTAISNARNSTFYRRTSASPGPTQLELRNLSAYVSIYPPDFQIPADAIDYWMAQKEVARFIFPRCIRYTDPDWTCAVFQVDLNGDGRNDLALLHSENSMRTLLKNADGSWSDGPRLKATDATVEAERKKDLLQAMAQGRFHVSPHQTQDFVIGDIRFR